MWLGWKSGDIAPLAAARAANRQPATEKVLNAGRILKFATMAISDEELRSAEYKMRQAFEALPRKGEMGLALMNSKFGQRRQSTIWTASVPFMVSDSLERVI